MTSQVDDAVAIVAVLQGVRTELRRLLGDTQPVLRWQEPLRQLLQTYLMPEVGRGALSFLTENVGHGDPPPPPSPPHTHTVNLVSCSFGMVLH